MNIELTNLTRCRHPLGRTSEVTASSLLTAVPDRWNKLCASEPKDRDGDGFSGQPCPYERLQP